MTDDDGVDPDAFPTPTPDNGPGVSRHVAMIVVYIISALVLSFFILSLVLNSWRRRLLSARNSGPDGPMSDINMHSALETHGVGKEMLSAFPLRVYRSSAAGHVTDDESAITIIVPKPAADKRLYSLDDNASLSKKSVREPSDDQVVAQDQEETCAICLCEYNDGDLLRCLPCGHEYHQECIDKWLLEMSSVCPYCRVGQRPINTNTPINVIPTAASMPRLSSTLYTQGGN